MHVIYHRAPDLSRTEKPPKRPAENRARKGKTEKNPADCAQCHEDNGIHLWMKTQYKYALPVSGVDDGADITLGGAEKVAARGVDIERLVCL